MEVNQNLLLISLWILQLGLREILKDTEVEPVRLARSTVSNLWKKCRNFSRNIFVVNYGFLFLGEIPLYHFPAPLIIVANKLFFVFFPNGPPKQLFSSISFIWLPDFEIIELFKDRSYVETLMENVSEVTIGVGNDVTEFQGISMIFFSTSISFITSKFCLRLSCS